MSFLATLVIAAVSGFIALSYEILWYRVIAFASWGLASAFGLLLAAYLLGIAVGSRISAIFCRDDRSVGDKRQLRAVGLFAFVANLVAWLVVPVFSFTAHRTDWRPGLIAVAIAAGLLGSILPLISHFGVAPDDKAGANLSYVYLANIVGSGAGSLITGFVFMDLWSLPTIAIVLAVLGFGLAAVLVAGSFAKSWQRGLSVALVAAAAVGCFVGSPRLYDRVYERLLFKKQFRDDTRFADVIETKSGVIAVTQDGTVYGGGAYDGRLNTSIVHDRNGITRAYAVPALHPAPREILMIGLSSGSWAKVISQFPFLSSLTVVEINPGYLQLIAKHPEVAGVLKDPKVRIVADDGRRWLHRNPEARFDVIVMNTTWHWRAHITNLVSQEFMALARSHLRQGGVFFFNTTASADVQKTAATVFPYAMRVSNFMAVSDSPLVFARERWRTFLEGFRIDGHPAIDLNDAEDREVMADLMKSSDPTSGPANDAWIETRDSVLARTADARIVTDDNMVPEWRELFRSYDPL